MNNTYSIIVKIINFLIRLANSIKLIQCKNERKCICAFCNVVGCKKRDIKIDDIISID